MNSCNFIGNVCRDIEVQLTSTGKKVAKFSVAINNGQKEATFLNCVAWEGTAELLEKYVNKGDKVGLVAKANTDSWTDKEGNKRSAVNFIVTNVTLIGGSNKSAPVSDNNGPKNHYRPSNDTPVETSEDLPF